MKRLFLVPFLALAACSTPPSEIPADLASPQALTVANNELFVASTDNDELRVLELSNDAGQRQFARAPNPIYVLSIPVAPRPSALAADMDGNGVAGSYLFSLSTVARRLSVVSIADKKEVAQLALPGTPLSLAARTFSDGGGARAFVGTAIGQQGQVVTIDLPPVATVKSDPSTIKVNSSYLLGNAIPAGIDVSPDGTTLAIGDRGADESSPDLTKRRGGLLFLGLADGGTSRLEVGGPVGRVRYSPAAYGLPDGGNPIPAGEYLYALVEGSGCPLGTRCGGIQIIHNGSVIEASPGVKSEPIRIPGAATDIAVATGSPQAVANGMVQTYQVTMIKEIDGGDVDPDAGVAYREGYPIVVGAPSTNGNIFFIDGTAGRLITTTADFYSDGGPQIGNWVPGSLNHLNPDAGSDSDLSGAPTNIAVAQGGLENQSIAVTYQGSLPVLIQRPAVVVGGVLQDLSADFANLGVAVGDEVDFEKAPDGCPTVATVTAIGTGSQIGQLTLSSTSAIPDTCYPVGGLGTYTVRAGGSSYVVAGLVSGYLGRTAANQPFSSNVPYFYRPLGYQPAKPALSFTMGAGDARRGAGYSFAIDSDVTPASARYNTSLISPGPIAWAPSLQFFYVRSPGAEWGSLSEDIAPGSVANGTSGTTVIQ